MIPRSLTEKAPDDDAEIALICFELNWNFHSLNGSSGSGGGRSDTVVSSPHEYMLAMVIARKIAQNHRVPRIINIWISPSKNKLSLQLQLGESRCWSNRLAEDHVDVLVADGADWVEAAESQVLEKYGADERTRTADLRITNEKTENEESD
jgi:hypothetical protein